MVEKERIMYVLDPDGGTSAGVEFIENRRQQVWCFRCKAGRRTICRSGVEDALVTLYMMYIHT